MKKGIPFALRTETPADIADFVNNNFREIFEERVGGYTLEELDDRYAAVSSSVVQLVHYKTSAVATGTTVLPFDNTIPQNTEGDEYMSLGITPKSSSNILVVEVLGHFSADINSSTTAALFKDLDTNAISVGVVTNTSYWISQIKIIYKMVAETTNQITFKVRCGPQSSGTVTFNGTGGNAEYGGKLCSYITIMEYST